MNQDLPSHENRRRIDPPLTSSFVEIFEAISALPGKRLQGLRTTGGVEFDASAETSPEVGNFILLPHSNRIYPCCWGYQSNHMGRDEGQRIGQYSHPLDEWFQRDCRSVRPSEGADDKKFTIYGLETSLEIVPLPMSAAEKLGEAIFFRRCMGENLNNLSTLPYYLSAFLTALRSVQDLLFKQYSQTYKKEFASWMAEKLQDFRNDDVLFHLFDLRDASVHREPIVNRIYVRSGPLLPLDGITTNDITFTLDTAHTGMIERTQKIGRDGPEIDVPSETHWMLPLSGDKEVDLFKACDHGITRLDGVLAEWNHQIQEKS